MYYPYREKKDTDQLCSYCTDQLCSYCTADLRLSFRLCILLVFYAAAHTFSSGFRTVRQALTLPVNMKLPSLRQLWRPKCLRDIRKDWVRQIGGPHGRVVKSAYMPLGCLTIRSSHHCVYQMWVRAPQGAHVRQAKFCLRVCQVVFLGVSRFCPTYWINK